MWQLLFDTVEEALFFFFNSCINEPWPGRRRRRTSAAIAPAWRIWLWLRSRSFPRSFCAPASRTKMNSAEETFDHHNNLCYKQLERAAHLEYFLLGSSLLDVLLREKLLQAGRGEKNATTQQRWHEAVFLTKTFTLQTDGSIIVPGWITFFFFFLLTLKIQACACALHEVRTESGPGCRRTRRPCRKTRGASRWGCRLWPWNSKKKKKACWSFSFGESSLRNRSSDKKISRSEKKKRKTVMDLTCT